MNNYILAIDTGTEKTAFVLYNKETKLLADRHWLPNVECIERLTRYFQNKHIEMCLIEMSAVYGAGASMSILENVLLIGIYCQLAKQYNIPVKLIFRKTVKLELCGSIRGINDAAVNVTIRDNYFGEPGCKTKKNLNPFYFNEETTANEARGELENNQWAALAILAAYLNNPKCANYSHQVELKKLDPNLLEYLLGSDISQLKN